MGVLVAGVGLAVLVVLEAGAARELVGGKAGAQPGMGEGAPLGGMEGAW